MARIRIASKQVLHKQGEAEIALGQVKGLKEVCKQVEVTEPNCYRWRHEYGGLRVEQASRLSELKREKCEENAWSQIKPSDQLGSPRENGTGESFNGKLGD